MLAKTAIVQNAGKFVIAFENQDGTVTQAWDGHFDYNDSREPMYFDVAPVEILPLVKAFFPSYLAVEIYQIGC
jgi:hypothetical protein